MWTQICDFLQEKCKYVELLIGMKRIETIEELHSILLNLAVVFHQICVEEKIPYYMVAGTLLGAVRHKGFIPWDDDMDFGVPRPYFKQLRKALKSKLPKDYSVYSKEDGIVASGILKITDNRTVHTHYWDENPNKQFGVSIDIFPIDMVNHKWKRLLIDVILKIQGYKLFDASNRPWHKRLLAYFVKVFFWGISVNNTVRFIEKYLIEYKGAYLSNTYGVYGLKEVMPKEYVGELQLLPFENTQFYSVAMPYEYLSHLYGDYMKLPPESKRHIHIKDMFWIA